MFQISLPQFMFSHHLWSQVTNVMTSFCKKYKSSSKVFVLLFISFRRHLPIRKLLTLTCTYAFPLANYLNVFLPFQMQSHQITIFYLHGHDRVSWYARKSIKCYVHDFLPCRLVLKCTIVSEKNPYQNLALSGLFTYLIH